MRELSLSCEVLVVSDPDGHRIGSGGGTLNALDCLRTQIGVLELNKARILIIHSGGDSRRAPLHSISGKAWASINTKGQVINKIKSTEKGVIEVKSFRESKKTLFSTYGNKIFFYFLLFYITLIFFLKKKEKIR